MSKSTKTLNIADYVEPLNMNGLQGRMLRMPAPKGKKREILFIYGHHSSLERWWGIVQNFNRYGAVTMPDLPGFGGMDSFYRIGEKATLDNLADYLAAFIKMRYKRRRVTIIGMSMGFAVATRMLQRYPDIAKKVDLLVSLAGFTHRDDFSFSRTRHAAYLWLARFFALPLTSTFFRYFILNRWLLKLAYRQTHNAKDKFKGVIKEEISELMKVEVRLWHDNDVRTYMKVGAESLTLDNCGRQVDLPMHHIAVASDRYFDNNVVEQHMRVIFKDFTLLAVLKLGNHAPSVVADAKTAAPFIPPKLRRLLAKQP
jgi:pimeloyl-ACP methyl ester carboxylesterase